MDHDSAARLTRTCRDQHWIFNHFSMFVVYQVRSDTAAVGRPFPAGDTVGHVSGFVQTG
jgi:hypothetical protein